MTWNCTQEAPLCDKRFVRRVVIPTRKFLALLGKEYDFNDGRESQGQLKEYERLMCSSKTVLVEAMTDTSVETILNITQYFHTCSILNSPWAKHAQWCCTCKECYKYGICEHTLMISIFIDKESVPDELDERMLQRKENTKVKARKFSERMEEKDVERQKRLIFEERELIPQRDADESWSGAGPSVGRGDEGSSGKVSLYVSLHLCVHVTSPPFYTQASRVKSVVSISQPPLGTRSSSAGGGKRLRLSSS